MIAAFAFLLAAGSVLASALDRGELGLLLAVLAALVGLVAYLEDRRSRDARRRNGR